MLSSAALLHALGGVAAGCLHTPDAHGHVRVPVGVTSIGDYAFSGCSSLASVELPAGLTSIGDDAFPSGCTVSRTPAQQTPRCQAVDTAQPPPQAPQPDLPPAARRCETLRISQARSWCRGAASDERSWPHHCRCAPAPWSLRRGGLREWCLPTSEHRRRSRTTGSEALRRAARSHRLGARSTAPSEAFANRLGRHACGLGAKRSRRLPGCARGARRVRAVRCPEAVRRALAADR